MSVELEVHCKQLTDDLIPQVVKRLNEYEMVVESQPGFTFSDSSNFWAFKFQLTNPPLELLKGKALKSGFELYISDFDLDMVKEQMKPKPSFWDKLLGKKQPEVTFCDPAVEKRLKDCRKVVTFVWHAGDNFQLRFASLASAILAELTDGVCSYPADEIWYDNKNLADENYKEIQAYEKELREQEIEFYEFDGWE